MPQKLIYFLRAKWHGEVALKVLYLENPTQEEKNDFKYKVSDAGDFLTDFQILLNYLCIQFTSPWICPQMVNFHYLPQIFRTFLSNCK